MSAGGTPAVLFYLLDRHALLAMTKGGKGGILCSALFAETDFGDGVATEIFIYFIFYFIFHI